MSRGLAVGAWILLACLRAPAASAQEKSRAGCDRAADALRAPSAAWDLGAAQACVAACDGAPNREAKADECRGHERRIRSCDEARRAADERPGDVGRARTLIARCGKRGAWASRLKEARQVVAACDDAFRAWEADAYALDAFLTACATDPTRREALAAASATVVAPPPPPMACRDALDNDGDGHVDHGEDPGCASPDDPDESDDPPPVAVSEAPRRTPVVDAPAVDAPGGPAFAINLSGVVVHGKGAEAAETWLGQSELTAGWRFGSDSVSFTPMATLGWLSIDTVGRSTERSFDAVLLGVRARLGLPVGAYLFSGAALGALSGGMVDELGEVYETSSFSPLGAVAMWDFLGAGWCPMAAFACLESRVSLTFVGGDALFLRFPIGITLRWEP